MACKYKVGKRQLTEQQLKDYQKSLRIDSKFSPVQLSDKLKKDYYDVLDTSEQEAINVLAPKDISTIKVFDDVKLFHYADEVKPNWSGLNGNIDAAKEALIKDKEVVDTFYQIEEDVKPTEPELKTKLLSFINTQGFEASAITEFEKSQKRNGKEFTVKGFVDLMNKVVKYDEQSLPEEAATVARGMYVKDDSTIYDQVRETETYKRVKEEYGGIYETELDIAKEALDKLLAQEIIRKDGTGRLATRLKRIWNKFISWVNGNKELTKFLDEMSSQILENNVVGLKNENVTGVFYQIDPVKFQNSKLLDSFKKELETAIRAKTARMKIYAAKSIKSFGKTEGRRIAELNKSLSNDKVTLGIVSFLNQTEAEGIGIQAKMKELLDKYDRLTLKEKAGLLNKMQAFLQAYEEPLKSIQSDIEFYPLDEKYDEIKNTLDNTIKLIGKLKVQYKKIGTVVFAETLYPFAEKNPEINNVEDLIAMLESKEDIGFYRRMMNSMANSTDDVLATVDQLVKRHKERARLASEDKIKDILALDVKLKENGIKDTEWIFESDSRNFVTKYKQQEYQDALNKVRSNLRETFVLPENKYERESFLNVYNDFKIKDWLSTNKKQLQPIIDKVNKKNRGASQIKMRELIWEEMVQQYKIEWAKWHEVNSQAVDNIEEVVKENLREFYQSQVFESDVRENAITDIYDTIYLNKSSTINLTASEVRAKELFEEWLSDRRRKTKKGKYYYVYELSKPADKYLNPQYDEIQNNPLKKEYYDKIMELKAYYEAFLPQRFVNKYMAPQLRKDLLARVKTGGVGKIKESLKDAVQIRESDTEYGQLVRDEDGNIVQFVLTDEKNNPVNFLPVYFANPIDDINDMSKDTTSIMASFMAMAENYKEMNKIVDVLELGNEILSQRKVEVGNNLLSKTSELFKGQKAVSQQTGGLAYQRYLDYMQMVVYGKNKEKESNKFLEKFNIDQAKLVDTFNKYTGISGLALNVSSGITNVVLGNVMARQEAFGKEYFNHKDLMKADKIYASEIMGVMGDIGKTLSNNKLRLFEETLDIFQDYSQRLYELETERSRFGKLINTSTLFFITKSGEYQVQNRTALAIANNTKVTIDGKESTVWDALEVKDYRLEIKPNTLKLDGTPFTQEDLIDMSLRIRGLNNKLHGIYSSIDQSAIQKWSLGRMAMLFRKFIVPGFNRRLEDKRFDYDSNLMTEGYYRSAFRFLIKLGSELKNGQMDYRARWNELSDMEKANFWRTMTEAAYVLAAMTAIGVLSNIKGDDDDWALNMASLQANRLYMDLRFYTSPTEFLRLMQSPAVGINQLNTLVNFSKSIDPFGYIFGEDPFIRELKSGKNKGETYFWVNLKKTIPVINQVSKTLNPDEQLIFYSR